MKFLLPILTLIASSISAQEPYWVKSPPIKPIDASLGVVLSDLESHMPKDHPYKFLNKITYAHEITHGISSRLGLFENRNAKNQIIGGYQWFYLLNDRSIKLNQPIGTTISRVANAIPKGVRGNSYPMYFITYDKRHEFAPLYVIDEWIAYTNDVEAAIELKSKGKLVDIAYTEPNCMLQFCCYSVIMSSTIPDNRDAELRGFIKWHLQRCMDLWGKCEGIDSPDNAIYWRKWREICKDHIFINKYLGKEWVEKTLFSRK